MSLVNQSLIDELIKFRKILHQNPELAFDVANTSKLIAKELQETGLEVTTGVGRNGIVASLNKGSGLITETLCIAHALNISELACAIHSTWSPDV